MRLFDSIENCPKVMSRQAIIVCDNIADRITNSIAIKMITNHYNGHLLKKERSYLLQQNLFNNAPILRSV